MKRDTRARIIGIYSDVSPVDVDGQSFYGKRIRFVRHRAMRRDSEYMKALFQRKFPGQDFVVISDDLNDLDGIIHDYDTVVLVYPDVIGQGAKKIEDYLVKRRKVRQGRRILNGRGREFDVNRRVLRRLRLRRLLENMPIVDCLLFSGLLITSPILLFVEMLWLKKDVYR